MFDEFQKGRQGLNRKNFLAYILIAAFLLIPGFLSIMIYVFTDSAQISDGTESVLEITDKNENVYKFTSTDSMSKLFYDIIESERKSASEEDILDFEENGIFKIMLLQKGEKEYYTFYFDRTTPSGCFFTDSEGKVFSVKADKAIAFMDSEYSVTLYPYAERPLITLNNVTAEPVEIEWGYYSYSSVKHDVEYLAQESVTTVDMSFLDFKLSFLKNPDSMNVKVKDSLGMEFFSGSYAEFVTFGLFSKVTASATYTCEIEAVWEDKGIGCCGRALYKFKLNVDFDPPGSFWLSADTVEGGGFVILSGKNIIDKNSITVTSIPSLDFDPMFFEDGEYIRAILPINIEKSREDIIYQIKVTYDGIHTEFTLKSSAPKTSVKKYNYSGKVQTSVRTQSNLNEFKEFITSGKYEETVYKSSTFISPTSNSFRASFGDTINNTSSKSDQFTSAGMAFVCYLNTACGDASDIEACLAGRVVAVGETKYGGNTVVVDHGLGLRSVYYCLKNVEVVVGTIVNPGDKIANGCAKKGYTDGETCYIEFWVGETPVSYKDLQINGFGMNFGEEPEI
ncbi:MAG: M23 family metallopeptidase [Ruminococcaceae bacterium]|nr:M23 family metallopeptidase [Oscillospiraceae bacterium]